MRLADAHLYPWLDTFKPVLGGCVSCDPLEFPGYQAQLERAAQRARTDESVVWGNGSIEDHEVVAVIFQFEFMGGSMGEATGRRLVAAIEHAARKRIPLITSISSGGARIQEGMRSLVQMQAVAAALARLRATGVPHVAILREPTTGGVWASLGSVADIILAVEGATIAFAGARVRGDTSHERAFTAQGKFEAGAVDMIVADGDLEKIVRRYVRVVAARRLTPTTPCASPRALPGADQLGSGWQAVCFARQSSRPHAQDYLDIYFEEFVELSGDRAAGRDPSLRCGIGLREGFPVAFIAQTGRPNRAAGFRTAIRVIDLADRWNIPVITLIDTPGAASDAQAEAEGIGTAIAQTFAAIAHARVPITSLVIGEGGSGGALALAAPDNLWAVPSSYFSVIAPEGAASILYRDSDRGPEVADVLQLAPRDLVKLGIIRGVVEPIPLPSSDCAA